MTVFEAEAGGYNAELMAIVIAPAWRQQLGESRYLCPAAGDPRLHPCDRLPAARRRPARARLDLLRFVRDRGAAARTTPTVALADGRVRLHFLDGPALETTGLDEALRGEQHEVPTGVVLPGMYSFATLQVYAATTLPGVCRITSGCSSEDPLVAAGAQRLPVLAADGSLPCLTTVQLHQGETPPESRWEFVTHAYGPAGPALADRLADCVRDWDQYVRHTGYPPMTVHPADTPDDELPAGDVLDKTATRLVFQWPGRPAADQPEVLAAAGSGA
ncbi:hypothetical protein [Streptomyces sp. RK75]|uniref:hypothetical protein n=1 Tax=Streptomyces sp. RK75 TaxID=2824895 RepID=UPI001B37B07C|nr:hypothetical protein [Streptomyces sp. RK75]MBQ0866354.1 hypothetical protein [Streptomyces sp. RK75]